MIPSMTRFLLLAKILSVIVCPISKFKPILASGVFLVANFRHFCRKYVGKKKILSKFPFFGEKIAKFFFKKKVAKIHHNLPTICKGCSRFSTSIFGILPNLIKYTFG
jgi:hypothetical protein